MKQISANPVAFTATDGRAKELFGEYQQEVYKRTDRLFAFLMIGQWFAGVALAVLISPRTWIGAESQIHIHLWASLFLGSIISLFSIVLALNRPGRASTRYVIAVGQMLMGALLIHLSGGRIETHFHIFGSLAFLAFYRDWRVLIPATLVVVADHFLRGIFFPQSVFDVLAESNWRWLEHIGWVVFIDVFLIISCLRGTREMREIAVRTVALEVGEERYRELFENANDIIYTRDLQGNFTSLNKTGERITGYTRDEAVKMNLAQVVAPEHLERARQMLARKIEEQKTPTTYEFGMTTKNGERRWLEVSSRLTYEDGVPVEAQCIGRDITERKRTEEALRASEERFQLAARATNDVIWDWDLATNGIWWNDNIQIVFGYSADEVGNNIDWWLEGIHPEDKKPTDDSIYQFLDSGEHVWMGEYRYARADGSYAEVIDRGIVVRDENGKPVRMIGTM